VQEMQAREKQKKIVATNKAKSANKKEI